MQVSGNGFEQAHGACFLQLFVRALPSVAPFKEMEEGLLHMEQACGAHGVFAESWLRERSATRPLLLRAVSARLAPRFAIAASSRHAQRSPGERRAPDERSE
jgi:hypothetical protein